MPRDENVRRIRSAVTRLSRRLRAERPADALAATKIAVLAELWRNGRMCAGDLASLLRVQPQSLTRTLAALEEDGLILRRPDELDRRQAVIGITEAGVTALSEDMQARELWLAKAMDIQLSPAERQLLADAAELMDRLADD
ncbi:MarR family winged helix-turn-helix transcriptional regulator [Kutzneria sp. CA-103260]|uniref:MarR family winged helix-turn-helix transcriptional regulator n=1 Tax=Kutzneria sp. CA-103260 TaxID=2802641 RepID=UPI001BAAAFC7|nr:MarR family transcriptional regulator [Kutzneria sp. CA-103260]QUQ66913.1 MarR family transcriptional regulator [Kutzneria sp. CA-103260]